MRGLLSGPPFNVDLGGEIGEVRKRKVIERRMAGGGEEIGCDGCREMEGIMLWSQILDGMCQ